MQANVSPTGSRDLPHQILRWLLVLLILLLGVALAVLANRLPTPVPEGAPATQFSAERAMKDVRVIARRTHPTGSAEIEETRRYLMERMAGLGLAPQIHTQTAIVGRRYFNDVAIGGLMRNIVGELKGSDPALPAVLLMAHYDTVPLSPGAGDDTSGVAVALEVARALKAAGPLRRSVIFLFTDGEEAGLLGSSAFFESDPLRSRIGPVINLEARGDRGKTMMFQTSANNRSLIDIYRRSVGSPAADSLMVTIYKRMPNDTDLTAALEQGHAGMNFAFVGHQMAYHTQLSTPDNLDPGSLQHMGNQVLPVAHALAQAGKLDQASEDAVFADLFGQYLVAYPSWLGWVLAIVAVGVVFASAGAGMARGAVTWRDAVAGAGGLLTLLLGIATMLMLAPRLVALLLSDVASPYALIGQFDWLLAATILLGIGSGALLIHAAANGRRGAAAVSLGAAGVLAALLGSFSLVPLVLGVAAALLALASLGRRVALTAWFTGAVALVALFALVLQIMLPNGAHALVWPLLLLAPVLALLLFAPKVAARPAGLVAMALPAALLAGLAARSGYDFFLMIGATLPAVIAPLILLVLLALVPLIWSSRNLPRLGLLCVAVGLAICIAAGIRGRTPTADSPEMVEAFYLADTDKGSASWVSGKLDSTGWVKAALAQDGGTARLQSLAPLFKGDHWVARAKPTALVRPGLALAVAGDGKERRISLSATNANGGRYMRIFLKPSVDLTGLALMDRPLPDTLKAGDWSQLTFHASGTEAVRLTMPTAGPSGQLEVEMIEVRDSWPEGRTAAPLPPHVIPYRRAGNSVIVARAAVKW